MIEQKKILKSLKSSWQHAKKLWKYVSWFFFKNNGTMVSKTWSGKKGGDVCCLKGIKPL